MPASLLHQSATVPSSDARAAAQRPGDATWSSHHNWQLNETLAPSGPLGEIYIVPPHTHIYTHTHTRMYTHTYAHTHKHTHMYTHTHTHMHTHTHICTHTHTHTHTH